jgi:hypothetical protein
MATSERPERFGLDPWEQDLAKMAIGWVLGMLIGTTLLFVLGPVIAALVA